MFVRIKKNRGYSYLQIVESRREGKSVKQRVLATLGQYDALAASGKYVDDLNRRDEIDGILIQLPLPARSTPKSCSTPSIRPRTWMAFTR